MWAERHERELPRPLTSDPTTPQPKGRPERSGSYPLKCRSFSDLGREPRQHPSMQARHGKLISEPAVTNKCEVLIHAYRLWVRAPLATERIIILALGDSIQWLRHGAESAGNRGGRLSLRPWRCGSCSPSLAPPWLARGQPSAPRQSQQRPKACMIARAAGSLSPG